MTDTGLIELAGRCEKATGPDRELDGAIKAALQIGQEWTCAYPEAARVWAVSYTASIDHALTLVPEGCGLHLHRFWAQDGERWACQVSYGLRGEHNDAEAVSKPLALCAAALRARAALTPPPEPTEK